MTVSLWTLLVTVVLAAAQRNPYEGPECSSSSDFSQLSTQYVKHLRVTVFDKIHYTSRELKYWDTHRPHSERRLLLLRLSKMDTDQNGLIDYNEGVRDLKKWGLRSSTKCRLAFMKHCDKDQSKSVSQKEWLDCFQIPACTKSCTHGRHLDPIWCKCSCAGNVIDGQVISFYGIPLRDARISLASAPYTQLTSSNASGQFQFITSCSASQYYTVKKDGYIPVDIKGAIQREMAPLIIHLEEAEPPSIVVQPKSQLRRYGQSANFKCKAEGTAPITITWYKNGEILRGEVHEGSNSSLYIADVTGAQGYYICKAGNEYGSEISSPAALTVTGTTEDTCQSSPRKHVLRLPYACYLSGNDETELNIGRCSSEPCLSSGSQTGVARRCHGNESCCCGPVETTQVEIQCPFGSVMTMDRVTKCGCSACGSKKTLIEGLVLRGSDKAPINEIRVLWKNKTLSTSNRQGKFSFTVPDEIDRLTVSFQDPTDRYLDTTMTLAFQRGQSVFHQVTLQPEDPPIEFDSTQELKVPVGHTGESVAELEIPADNLLKADGTPFKGKAKLRLSVTDPRNVSDLLSAPGDFTTVDQSGNIQQLKTYGILRIKVVDDSNQQLNLARNPSLSLDADKLKLQRNATGEMLPRLWWLDEKTARWRDMGEMQLTEHNTTRDKRATTSGRRFYIGEIQTDRISVVNIDIPWKRCYVRAQALTTSKEGTQPLDGAQITLIGGEYEDQEQYYGYAQTVTDGNGIACIPAWCDSSAYLQAKARTFVFSYDQNQIQRVIDLVPDNVTLQNIPPELEVTVVEGRQSSSIYFTAKAISSEGPVFQNDELAKCHSPANNIKTFKFYTDKSVLLPEFEYFGSRPLGHPLSWYTTDSEAPKKEVKKCFVKVVISADSYPRVISVESYTPDRKQLYGFSVKRYERTGEKEQVWYDYYDVYAACVEYRCSEPGRETFLKITALSGGCPQFAIVRPLFMAQSRSWHDTLSVFDHYAHFYAPVGVADGKLGLYTGIGDAAEEQCHRGEFDGQGDLKIKSDGYAVKFKESAECPEGWWNT